MKARDLFTGAELKHPLPPSLADAEICGLDYDSRRVEPGFAFFAFTGSRVDGREFARQAVAKGAVVIASEAEAPDDLKHLWVTLAHGRRGLAIAARNFYGKPDERLGLTGITGTNGKTTTGFLIDGILRASGAVTALIGTIEYRLGGRILPAVNTTPESLDVVRLLSELESIGGTHATMEVSSHALELGRVFGLHFHTAVFSQSHARPSRFPWRHGPLLRRQAASLRWRGRSSA